jgi:hypothetical protein
MRSYRLPQNLNVKILATNGKIKVALFRRHAKSSVMITPGFKGGWLWGRWERVSQHKLGSIILVAVLRALNAPPPSLPLI